jgi:hypothetical protein
VSDRGCRGRHIQDMVLLVSRHVLVSEATADPERIRGFRDVRPVFRSPGVVQQHPYGDPIRSGSDLRAFEWLDVSEDLEGALVNHSRRVGRVLTMAVSPKSSPKAEHDQHRRFV